MRGLVFGLCASAFIVAVGMTLPSSVRPAKPEFVKSAQKGDRLEITGIAAINNALRADGEPVAEYEFYRGQ